MSATEDDRAEGYTITPCGSCKADSAVVVRPPRYVCVVCGETGTASPGGVANIADDVPEQALKDAFRALWDERPSMREFTKLAKAYRRERLRSVGGTGA